MTTGSTLGDTCNTAGPLELRLLEVTKKGRTCKVQVLPDKATDEMLAEVGVARPDNGDPVYASRYAFEKIRAAALADLDNPRHIVFFVHGFNNSLEDVVLRCDTLSKTYGVEVVAFSWPANGGGIRGVASYLDDKRDAQASVGAFDRAMEKARVMLHELRTSAISAIVEKASRKFPDNSERFRDFLTREAEKQCPVRSTLMLHSMGNYLLERTLKSTALRGDRPLFDNMVMCAADLNNPNHAEWVDRLQPRNRLYITINEDDSALKASRLKGGDEQLARLGHWTSNLNSSQAVYVNFTNANEVQDSHAYFEGGSLKNTKVKRFFKAALHGLRAEQELGLEYDSANNLYHLP